MVEILTDARQQAAILAIPLAPKGLAGLKIHVW